MEITVKDKVLVTYVEEVQAKLIINGKEVWVSKISDSEVVDVEIFKGKELLNEDEEQDILDYAENELFY